ncbi:hypothetical protein EXU48_00435 [Occultella glacieicola]|uniref:Carbohydrate-binding domain-containing protein n=1 Tax=Occultella glacieicola TaxID=2518684 RepID=A0ABY2E891_9MICO|nr:sugar-binding protein [Occultella glacieicola]TDE98718.1 hypothetical protein EXU48_00435 [Occultella glacieicola]
MKPSRPPGVMRGVRRPLAVAAATAVGAAVLVAPAVPAAADDAVVTASVTFDDPPVNEGITVRTGDAGRGTWLEVGGLPALQTNPSIGNTYIYNDIDDALIHGGTNTVRITVEYYDAAISGGSWDLTYDAATNPWRALPAVALTGSNTWRTEEFTVTDARLSNRENGADLRIGTGTSAIAFRSVTVERLVDAPALSLRTPGNIFVTGTPPKVDFTAAPDARVDYRVYDVNNNHVTQGVATNTDGAGTIQVGTLPEGYYRLRATATISGQASLPAETTLAVVAPQPDAANSPFAAAVSHRQLPPGSAPLAALAGDSYYRPSLTWTAMERTAGVYTYPTAWQEQTIEARDAGLAPMPICAYTNPLYDNDATPYTDAGRAAFADYCVALLDGYVDLGNPAPAVEVYNEFNAGFGDRGDGPANSLPEYYFPLLQATYEAVKAAHPDTLVVGPATSWPDLGWLETLFALGALDYMDVVSVHYPGDPPEAAVANLEAVDALVREYNNGESKPIWVSEWGWSSRTGSVDEHTQAAYAARAGVIGLSQGVERNFWYDFNNDGLDPADHESNFGLLRNAADPLGALTPKPSYAAHATMSRLLTGATFEGAEEVADGATAYQFATAGGDNLLALWSTTGPRTVTIETRVPVTVVEMSGRARTLTPYLHSVELTLTGDPVYVIGSADASDVTDGGRFSLTAAGPTLAGDTIQLTLDVDKVGGPRMNLAVTVNERTVPVQVASGQATVQIPISIRDTGLLGTRGLVALVTNNGSPVARLTAEIDVLSTPVTVSAAHTLREDADVLTVSVTNEVATDQPVGDLAWQLGAGSGTETIGTLPAGQTVTIDIPTTGLTSPGTHPWSVNLAMPDADALTESGSLVLVDPAAVTALHQQAITVDGVPDDLSGITPIDLDADGQVRQIPDWGGAADLGGDVWWTWDEENLYLTAAITDNVHAQPGLNDTIWTGDSIQFGAVAGAPGENLTGYYEYGLALTAQGPQVFRWNGGGGILPNGPVDAVDLAVARDEATQTTVYEMAMPWSELAPFDPADRLLALSFLVNENDGAIRRGWLEWGSGIGTGKNPALFPSTRLDP